MVSLLAPARDCPRDLSTLVPAIRAIQRACKEFVQSQGKDVKALAWANYVAGYLSLRLAEACCKSPATVAGAFLGIGDTIFNLQRPLPELLTKRDFETYLQDMLHGMDREIGPRGGRRRGELLPEAWGKTCNSMTRYSQ